MSDTRFIRSLGVCILALSLTLAACGGGGSSDTGSSGAGGSNTGGDGSTVVEKPAITTQPASQSVVTNSTATFMVTATGGAPLAYQWKKNGTDISGATSNTYTTPATSMGDNAAVFAVVVSNSAGTATSSNATLTVTAADVVGTRYSLVGNSSGGTYALTECVKDNSTGLVWEGKPTTGIRAARTTYTNYDSTTSFQKSSGRENATQAEIDASNNSIGYRNSVNASALCGYTDWRLPTKDELLGIVASSGIPKIDTTWFPNTQASVYWSLSPYVGGSYDAWGVNFYYGYVSYYGYGRNKYYHVRLVR